MNVTPEDSEDDTEKSSEWKNDTSSSSVFKAIQALDLHQHHETIHDPNELIDTGFPAIFLLPLISIYDSSGRYQYFRCGTPVQEIIGISHLDLIYAFAKYLGVSSEVGLGFTGRGFAMNAIIDAINDILREEAKGVIGDRPRLLQRVNSLLPRKFGQ